MQAKQGDCSKVWNKIHNPQVSNNVDYYNTNVVNSTPYPGEIVYTLVLLEGLLEVENCPFHIAPVVAFQCADLSISGLLFNCNSWFVRRTCCNEEYTDEDKTDTYVFFHAGVPLIIYRL